MHCTCALSTLNFNPLITACNPRAPDVQCKQRVGSDWTEEMSGNPNGDWTVIESKNVVMDLVITDLLILAKKERVPAEFTVVSDEIYMNTGQL